MALLYAACGGPVASDLYRINPVTGAATSVGPIGYAITGLAFHPGTGDLYGVTSNSDPTDPASLVTINVGTGTGALIGALGSGPCPDISFAPDGTLYGLENVAGNITLVTIDLGTGAATPVGAPVDTGVGYAFAIDANSASVSAWDSDTPAVFEFQSGRITSFDLATGAASYVGSFSGDITGDGAAVTAFAIDAGGLIWGWINNYNGNCLLVTLNTNGDTVLVATVPTPSGVYDGAVWDALAWDENAGELTFLTGCPNDLFGTAQEITLGTSYCCNTINSTNTDANDAWFAAQGTRPFVGPLNWYHYAPAGDITAAVVQSNPAQRIYVYEGDPGYTLNDLATANNLVASVFDQDASATWAALSAKEYWIIAEAGGTYGIRVVDAATYPPTLHEDLSSFYVSSPYLAPDPNHNFDNAVSNLGSSPGSFPILALLDQDESGLPVTVDLDFYVQDGSFSGPFNLDTFSDTSVLAGGIYLPSSGRASVAVATDADINANPFWVGVLLSEYNVGGTAETAALLVYEVNYPTGTLVQTLSGVLLSDDPENAAVGVGAGSTGRMKNRGEVRSAAFNGVGYFAFAQVTDQGGGDYLGEILVLGSDGSTFTPYSQIGATSEEVFRPDFDMAVDSAGTLVFFIAGTPSGSAQDDAQTETWGISMVAQDGTVLNAGPTPPYNSFSKICYPSASHVHDGVFYVAMTYTNGWVGTGGNPSIVTGATDQTITLVINEDGTGGFQELPVNQSAIGTTSQEGAAGRRDLTVLDDSLNLFIENVTNFYDDVGIPITAAGVPVAQQIRATIAYLCPPGNIGWQQGSTQISEIGTYTGGTDPFSVGFVYHSAVTAEPAYLPGECFVGLALVVGTGVTNEGSLFSPMFVRDLTVECPPPIPLPACGTAVPLITSGPDNPTTSFEATFTFEDADSPVVFECRLDGGSWGTCTSPAHYIGLTLGPHTFEVRAVGDSGTSDPASYDWEITLPPPRPPYITDHPEPETIFTTATFEFTDIDSPVTYECSLDGDAYVACSSPSVYADMVPGAHTFAVRAVSDSGTSDPTSFAWTILAAPVAATRFFQGYPWRFVITDLSLVTTTWAQGLLSGRKVVQTLGQATVIESDVNPDDFRVYGLWTDDYPRINQSNRLVFGFRRSGPTNEESSTYAPWECAAAGIIMAPEDEGDEDVQLTHFVAYDPRKLVEARPVVNEDGDLWPGDDPQAPWEFPTLSVGEIALTCLKNTIMNSGGVFIDAGPDWGGTAQWEGVIEATDTIEYQAQPGSTVASVWNELEATGLVEFILRPIYDPDRFITVDSVDYYFTHELSVYVLAGQERPAAPFAWGRLMNNVAKIERMHDATPGNFFNIVLYYAGQGGLPVPITGPSIGSGTINGTSVAAFGEYWQTQFFPAQKETVVGDAVLMLARQALKLVKQGKRTVTLDLITERAPVALIDFEIGDRVPVYAPHRLRNIAEGYQRVEAIPIEIQDENAYEQVNGLLTSPDWNEDASGS